MRESYQGECDGRRFEGGVAAANDPCKIYSFAVLLLLVASIAGSSSALYLRVHRSPQPTSEAPEEVEDSDELELAERKL